MCGIWDGSCVRASIHGLVVVEKQFLTVENKTKYFNVIFCFDGTSVSKTVSKFQKQRGSEMSTDRPTDCGINFYALLACKPQGNHGYVGMFFYEKEITPKIQGTLWFNASDKESL
jgi:xylulokinase